LGRITRPRPFVTGREMVSPPTTRNLLLAGGF
jgi:hypothetical protein